MVVNGVPSSYVNLDDPTRLDFEYMQWAGRVVDAIAPAGTPIDAVHVGGAGCTLPLYISATRAGSRQTVFEVDAALVTLARRTFGLRGVAGLRIRTGDGRAGLAGLPAGSSDVVIRDAFAGRNVPVHLTTTGFCRDVARVLRPSGVYVANVADSSTVREAKVEAAAALKVFAHVALMAEPAQLRGRRFGNVILIASNAELPKAALTRKLAGGAVRARLVPPERVVQLVSGVAARDDLAT